MLQRLELPAGALRIGTEYQSKGRWYDLQFVRWLGGSLRPIGGWVQFGSGTFTGNARGIYAWTDASNNRWLAFGTYAKLLVANSSATISDITPAGFTSGQADASYSTGYGKSTYGTGLYGTARADTGTVTPATTWALDGWGQYLVGCSDSDGKLYMWQLDTGTPAAAITNAPTGCAGLVVTQERFIFALGASGDPRQIKWCDQGAETVWTAASTNQAGSFKLETDGKIRCGIKQPSETLILTSSDLWSARYIGAPLVYSFRRIGSGCGSPCNRAAIKLDNKAVWLGNGGFFIYDGYVRKLRCDVWDLFEQHVSAVQISKTFGWHNIDNQEACWLVPSDTGNECDWYVTWNYVEDWWSFCQVGQFARSCGVGPGTFGDPILCGTDGKLYRHEVGNSYGSSTLPYAKSGPYELGDGEEWMYAMKLIPDEGTLAQTTLTFKTRAYPNATETSFGPYTMADPTSVRFSGRQVEMLVSAVGSSDWRFGVPRLELVSGGKR